MAISRLSLALFTGTLATIGHQPWAQPSSAAERGPAQSAQHSAPIDLRGQWVSIVNEDWRWRMMTAPPADTAGVPLSGAGHKIANAWNPAEDGSCKAYGAAGLMRLPLRVRITWESGDILRIETDSGQQVRRLHFIAPAPSSARTLTGRSVAHWERTIPPGDGWGFGPGGPPGSGGSLKVVTTQLQPGWLRRNGVPYGEKTVLTEYYDRFSAPDGSEWFVVTTIVEDPEFLAQPFVTSSHFRRESSSSAQWSPRPCRQ